MPESCNISEKCEKFIAIIFSRLCESIWNYLIDKIIFRWNYFKL